MGNYELKPQAQTVRHPKLGQVIPKQRYGKQYIIYSHLIPSGVSLDAWQQQYHKLSNCRKDSLFLPETYVVRSGEVQMRVCCSNPTIVDLTYQNYIYLLDQEIQNRKRERKYYTEPDLWFMLYHLLSGANEMEIRDIRIGDVRPKNILLDQNGSIKIITRMSWPGEESGFEKVLRGEGQKCYLAPEELRALTNMRETIDLKSNKTEAFSIGVTTLELALLESSEDLYNYKDNIFNKGLMDARIQRCSQRYSVFFTQVVKMLTDMNPKERLSSGECWATLSPYGEYIDNVIQFTPDRYKSQRALDQYMKTVKAGKF